ncbi:MAG: hypothetical protein HYX61_05340 [Gammaproteobacteria bacterium]|jgi:hypothetical protein|nr:hypothetical protein [Gammaproteobacteria bacterium]
MEEYYCKIAEHIKNSNDNTQDDSEGKIVETAKNASIRAQWLCWVVFNVEQRIADKVQSSNLINQYISGILLKCHQNDQKATVYFPWLKKPEKLRDEHERMVHSYFLHLAIKAFREAHRCSRREAINTLAKHAMEQTSSERKSGKTKFFERFNTTPKLEKELRYYKQNYKNWAFLFEIFVDFSFSPPFKFQPPGQYTYDTHASILFKKILVDLKVQS